MGTATKPFAWRSSKVHVAASVAMLRRFGGWDDGAHHLSRPRVISISKIRRTGGDPERPRVEYWKTRLIRSPRRVPPLIVDKVCYLVDGHHRLAAAEELGCVEVPVRFRVWRGE